MGSLHPHQTSHTADYSSADTPTIDPNPLARGPVVHKYSPDTPLSRPDCAFRWCQVAASLSDNLDQPFFPMKHMQAVSPVQATSAFEQPDEDGFFWSAELTARRKSSAELLAGDRHATQPQPQTQTQAQSQTLSKICTDEMMPALSSMTHPAKLAADMQKLLQSSKPVHTPHELHHRLESIGSPAMKYSKWYKPQQLQNQLESTGSPVPKYTDWYRHSLSPAATTAALAEQVYGMDSLGPELTANGFGGYGSTWTGAQGPLAAGRAAANLPGLSRADQPSAGTQGFDLHIRKRRRLDIIEAFNQQQAAKVYCMFVRRTTASKDAFKVWSFNLI